MVNIAHNLAKIYLLSKRRWKISENVRQSIINKGMVFKAVRHYFSLYPSLRIRDRGLEGKSWACYAEGLDI